MAKLTPTGETATDRPAPNLIRVIDAIDHASAVCKHTSAGLDMLLMLLSTSPDLQDWHKDAFTGLLRPMVGELERTHDALRASLQ